MATKILTVFDIIKIKLLNTLTQKKPIHKYLSSDSFFLSLYFNFGSFFFFLTSCCIFYNVFMTDTIFCNDGFDLGSAKGQKIFPIYINYCLSYPMLLNKKKSFALFYKWVPWITTVVSFLLYTPKIVMRKMSCNFIALNFMRINDPEEAEGAEKNDQKQSCCSSISSVALSEFNDNDDNVYNISHVRREKGENKHHRIPKVNLWLGKLIRVRWNRCTDVYWKCLFSHAYALILNVGLIYLLDFFLQGQFVGYVPQAFPFRRNMTTFLDETTQIFYPFCECTLTIVITGRVEKIRCHLTLMEYYEKIFIFVWFYLIILLILTLLYTLYLCSLFRDNYNAFLEHLLKKHLNFHLLLLSKNIIKKKREECHYAKVV